MKETSSLNTSLNIFVVDGTTNVVRDHKQKRKNKVAHIITVNVNQR